MQPSIAPKSGTLKPRKSEYELIRLKLFLGMENEGFNLLYKLLDYGCFRFRLFATTLHVSILRFFCDLLHFRRYP